MSNALVAKAENLTKIYKLYNSPLDRLKETLHPLRRTYHQDFYALNEVNFEISKGESVGFIGRNGSGKSTLLKILTGVLTPTSGTVKIIGKVSALLELGAGFNPELTGIENIYFNGMLMGSTREEMDKRLEDVLSFADIGKFVYQPVKTYSSGMFVRLAFAVAINIEPEIMIVDEALSVGDAYFQQKCLRKIRTFKDRGGTIIFVSHDMGAVKTLCDRAFVMKSGNIVDSGYPGEMADLYMSMIMKEELSVSIDTELVRKVGYHESGSVGIDAGAVMIRSVTLTDNSGLELMSVMSETDITVTFNLDILKEIKEPIYGIHLRDRCGVSVFETHSVCMGIPPEAVQAGDSLSVAFSFNCNLFPGDYSISFGCCNKPVGTIYSEEALLWQHDVIILKVMKNEKSIEYAGYFNLKPTLELVNARKDSGMQIRSNI
jgi:lipopolysaccharide transport system ATP-binding protein